MPRRFLAPGAPSPQRSPFGGRCKRLSGGPSPSRRRCPWPSAGSTRAREGGAQGSAYLPLLTDKSRSVQLPARACLAADPGEPGAARSTPGRASAGRLAGRKAPLRELGRLRARPPPPPPPPAWRARPAGPRAAARVPPARLSDSHEEAEARRAPGTPARRLARGSAEPAPAARLRAPPMSSFTAIVFGEISEPGRAAGAGRGREPEGSPCRGPGSQLLREQRAEERAPSRAPPPVRLAGTEAGGALDPWGWRRGRRRARRPRVRGVGDPEGVEEPPPVDSEPQPRLEEAVEGAAGGSRLRTGCTGASAGLWAVGGAVQPGNLLSLLPWSRRWSSWRAGTCVSSGEGVAVC